MRFLFTLLLATVAFSVRGQVVPDTLRAPADSIYAFGWTTATDDDRLLVGAGIWPHPPAQSTGDHKGTVFVYRPDGEGGWTVEGRLHSDNVGNEDCFSWSLALHADVAAVGARCESGLNPDGNVRHGVVYLYRYQDGAWSRDQKLYPSDVPGYPDVTYYFGFRVALSDDLLVVGAPYSPNPSNPDADWDSGVAYVFEYIGGRWVHTASLRNDDADEQLRERFGWTVAKLGDDLVIGAPSEGLEGEERRGALYVFRRSEESWSQVDKLLAPEPVSHAYFGTLLSGTGNSALVGSQANAAYPLDRNNGQWVVGESLPLSDYLVSLARDGDRALTVLRDQAVFFEQEEQGWVAEEEPITPLFGWVDELASVTSRYAVVGHPAQDPGEEYVLVYDFAAPTASEPTRPGPTDLTWTLAPNPSKGAVVARIVLAETVRVRLDLFDLLGRRVTQGIDRVLSAGTHALSIDTGGVAPGTYLVRLAAGDGTQTQRLTISR